MTVETPSAVLERDKLTPEILSRLDYVRRTSFKLAKLLARAGAHRERRQSERILTACKEIHELVRSLDELPRQLADSERARQDHEDSKILKDKVAVEAEAVNDG